MFFNPLLTFYFKMFISTKAGIGALMLFYFLLRVCEIVILYSIYPCFYFETKEKKIVMKMAIKKKFIFPPAISAGRLLEGEQTIFF